MMYEVHGEPPTERGTTRFRSFQNAENEQEAAIQFLENVADLEKLEDEDDAKYIERMENVSGWQVDRVVPA